VSEASQFNEQVCGAKATCALQVCAARHRYIRTYAAQTRSTKISTGANKMLTRFEGPRPVEERTTQLAQAHAEISTLNQRLAADNLRMSAELDLVRQMQHLILPTPDELAAIDGLDIAAFMEELRGPW